MVKNTEIKMTLEDILPMVFRFLVKAKLYKAAKYLQKDSDFDLTLKVI